ncbi:MAG TPA: hypothetical protein PLW86_07745, partial [Rhodocyclaceae bacterium]|nr:hypothetical protein [Rhodocyclaceae bacterium]
MPDLGSSINTVTQEGVQAGNFAGNQQGLIVLGRFPWKSLGIAPPRDSSGECLWYAVSGNFQQERPAGIVNWDTPGNFEVLSSGGTHAAPQSQTGINPHNRPVAIIFSAGPVLPGQDRSASSTDNVSECGGNYDARNYLDPVNSGTALNNIINYFNNPTKRNAYPNIPESLKQLLAGNVTDTAA